jgi:hypothetical protein
MPADEYRQHQNDLLPRQRHRIEHQHPRPTFRPTPQRPQERRQTPKTNQQRRRPLTDRPLGLPHPAEVHEQHQQHRQG